ncbi:uncharacterized protein YjbI with pentapeptide repeats [Rhodanobacter sp. K2T2]|uniref:hypothetical protein n=1 Tax=Rhodanobacter sp. K2T2 TaxID=2723085 RepID=UPI0015C84805|nr:hypothetical protein [Rhodanobacter sp. K2T2]NYE27309.1 uncharacterized protein YjbI with pentapeptide repeats [Rhodanobacter sp. K2T2]
MYLLGTVLLVLWGMYVYPGDISNIPFAQLTMAKLVDAILSGALFVGAVYLGFESLSKDKIWPWRWTWLYVASLLARTVACCFLIGTFYFIVLVRFKLDGGPLIVSLIVLAILLLSTMLNAELDFEKKRTPGANLETS